MGSRIKSKDSSSLRGHNISSTAPSNGEALVYDGTEYTPNTVGGGTPALNNGDIFVGNVSNAATSVAMSGDTAITNTGAVTIQADAVTYDKMQDTTQACILGNQTGSGTVDEIPVSQMYLAVGATTVLLENTSNWDINGNYTGTAITGTYQGQAHYNGNYWFTAVDDNVWIRLIRG
jgi:hypothetical protein